MLRHCDSGVHVGVSVAAGVDAEGVEHPQVLPHHLNLVITKNGLVVCCRLGHPKFQLNLNGGLSDYVHVNTEIDVRSSPS